MEYFTQNSRQEQVHWKIDAKQGEEVSEICVSRATRVRATGFNAGRFASLTL
jgi:hypothetical protein